MKSRIPVTARTRVKRLAAPMFSRDLVRLAKLYRANKPGYLDLYDRHFSPLRRKTKSVLEIGIGGYDDPREGGGSLRMWRTYFPNAEIHGVDIHPKAIDERRVTTHVGSQDDVAFLSQLADRYGPFDIIIDDGSHVSAHVILTFETLFPHLVPGGIYAIEDVGAAYWPAFGGGPPGTDQTSIAMTKDLLDGLNHRAWATEGGNELPYAYLHAYALHAYERIALIEKRRHGPSQYRLGPPTH